MRVLVVVIAMLLALQRAAAEAPVQQAWECQAGSVKVVSNTPCSDGAQAVTPATSVIYHCVRKGVSEFQQTPCGATEQVHLYNEERSAATLKQGAKVHSKTVAAANAARAEQRAQEGSDYVTVVGKTPTGNRTAGDGKSDGYRKPNRSTGGSGDN